MVTQTLYDILEVSEIASQDNIRAAWDRLSVQWDPARPHNADAEARGHYAAIKNAYATLSNVQKRAVYDRQLRTSSRVPVKKRSKVVHMIAVALFIAGFGAYQYSDTPGVARITAGKTEAAAKPSKAQQPETAAKLDVGIAPKHQQHSEPARRSESVRLRLDTEFSSEAQFVSTASTQL